VFRLSLTALLVLSAAAAARQPARPNILFCYTDDQSHRTVSRYPEVADWVKTPNTDRL